MAKSAGQKLRPLYLARILTERSDEEHPLTVQELISALQAYGVEAERKTIYDDIETLEQFGLDIVTVRGRSNAYHIGERAFQLPELKLLVDVVQASRFITAKKSGRLIEKISALASEPQARQLSRQVYVAGRPKAVNEGIYYNVDTLHGAISDDRQISFFYYEWAVDRAYPRLFDRRYRRGGESYRVSPWALSWDDENYYLIAFDSEADKIKHYRVDKMADIRPLEPRREGREHFEQFDLARYTRMTFGMFGGLAANVRLRFSNRLIGVVADRFGGEITIHPSGEEHFTVNVEVAVSPQFTGWLLGFGAEAELLSPDWVRERLVKELSAIKALYREG